MKLGDLVSLSAYGQAREYNYKLTKGEEIAGRRQFGIIVSINLAYTYSYVVQWNYSKLHYTGKPYNRWTHSRREIKHIRNASRDESLT